MRFRKLRIAWSMFWGVACVLLIVLWARSYSWHDTVSFDDVSRNTAGGWNKGELFFVTAELPLGITLPRKLTFRHEEPDYEHNFEGLHFGFGLTPMPGGFLLVVPFWFATIGSIACTVMPWLPWSNRFTLRTLLIATTVVAVVLGFVVWAASK